MNSNGALEKILHSFERYYSISTENVDAPFVAEATFKSHNEQYFLIKAAKVADIDSNDFVFFYSGDDILSAARLAWERGLSRIKPYYGHRNTDISLIIISDKISDEDFKQIKKINYYKSYKFGLYGWSAFRTLAYETSTGRAVTNRRGSDLKKIVAKI